MNLVRYLMFLSGWCSTLTLLRPFARHLVGKMGIQKAHLLITKHQPAISEHGWSDGVRPRNCRTRELLLPHALIKHCTYGTGTLRHRSRSRNPKRITNERKKKTLQHQRMICICWIFSLWMFPKLGVDPPNHPFVHRVFSLIFTIHFGFFPLFLEGHPYTIETHNLHV